MYTCIAVHYECVLGIYGYTEKREYMNDCGRMFMPARTTDQSVTHGDSSTPSVPRARRISYRTASVICSQSDNNNNVVMCCCVVRARITSLWSSRGEHDGIYAHHVQPWASYSILVTELSYSYMT